MLHMIVVITELKPSDAIQLPSHGYPNVNQAASKPLILI